MNELKICQLKTQWGIVSVEFNARGITRLQFGRSRSPVTTSAPRFIRNLATDLRRYANGQPVRWRVPLAPAGGTPFQRRVWRALRAIPDGETRSYAWVAKQVGRPRAARAVGAACGANPIPILIPCHRVIASDGSLGGYSGGLIWKRRLLRAERTRLRTEK